MAVITTILVRCNADCFVFCPWSLVNHKCAFSDGHHTRSMQFDVILSTKNE